MKTKLLGLASILLVTGVLLPASVSAQPCTLPPTGLVGWWSGDGNARDLAGTNHGTLGNEATYAEGEVRQAFKFDGVDDYVSTPLQPPLGNSPRTITLWAKTTVPARAMVGAAYGGSTAVAGSSFMASFNLFEREGVAIDMSWAAITYAAVISDGLWHFYAWVLPDGAEQIDQVRVYMDGARLTNYAYAFNDHTTIRTQPGLLEIGRYQSLYPFQGSLDEVSVFDRALSSNEIAAIYAAGSAGMCKSPAPPAIVYQPQSQTVPAGTVVSLSVVAIGAFPLTHQWRFNGTNILNATNATFILPSAQLTDSGDYRVIITNVYGAVTSAPARLTVVLTPDLQLGSVGTPVEAWTDSRFDMSWRLTNAGRALAAGPWLDRVYLSRDDQPGNDILLGEFPFPGQLEPGQAVERIQAVAIGRAGITNGTYYIVVETDAAGALVEGLGETNNFAVSGPLAVRLTPVPDLIVEAVEAPPAARGGQTITVTWQICNLGDGATDAPYWYDHVYLSTPANGSGVIKDYGEFENPSYLAPGECYEAAADLTLPTGISGPHYLLVETDSQRHVFEADESNNLGHSASAIQVEYVAPGFLHVESVIVAPAPPTTVWAGEPVTVTWTVRNTGGNPIDGSWDDVVTLSPTNYWDGTHGYWGLIHHIYFTGPLAVGAAYTHTEQMTVPSDITAGLWYAVPVVDTHYFAGGDGGIGSGNIPRDQNAAPITVALPLPADLEVTSILAPTSAISGQPWHIQWKVFNNGANATRRISWNDAVYLARDAVLDTSAALLLGTFGHSGALDPGSNYTQTVDVTVPVGLAGTFHLFVQTDSGNTIYEGPWETNNATRAPLPIQVIYTPPDLQVTSLTVSGTAIAGQSASVAWTVQNNGTGITLTGSWIDRVYLSADEVLQTNSDLLLATFPHSGALEVGQSYQQNQTVPIPNCSVGDFYVFVVTDSDTQVNEGEGNNTLRSETPLRVVAAPNARLRVSSITAPATATAGQSAAIGWTVTNAGNTTATGPWVDKVYLSSDTTFDGASDFLLGSFPHAGDLALRRTYSTNQTVTLPDCLAGSFYVFVVADAGNHVNAAVCETNNFGRASTATAVAPGNYANLRVSLISLPANANAGEPMSFGWTVTNAATTAATGSWIDTVYLSAQPVLNPTNNQRLGDLPHSGSLSAGSAYTNGASFTLSSDLAGDFYLIVSTDSTNAVRECSGEADDTVASAAPIHIRIPTWPDLQVTAVSAPASAFSGQIITVGWSVTNAGTAPTPPGTWYDAVYLSKDRIVDPTADHKLGAFARPGSLAVGGSYAQSVQIEIPRSVAGPYYVIVMTDSSGTVAEQTGENNNIGLSPTATFVTMSAPADLLVTRVRLETAAGLPGQPATITWTVQNQGTNTAVGPWTDAVYLSTNTAWDLDAVLVGRKDHNGNLPSFASYTEALTAPLPALTPGNYYAIVRADLHNNVREVSEANNAGASTNTISVDVPELVLGVPQTNFLSTGTEHYYKVNVPAGEDLLITLDSSSTNSANELYVRYGAVPYRGHYDFAYSDPGEPDQRIIISGTQAGWYYLLVRCESTAQGNADFTLTATKLAFCLTSVMPTQGGNVGSVTLRMEGARIDGFSSVELVHRGSLRALPASWTNRVNSGLIYATFDLRGAPAGAYDLRLSSGNDLISYDELSQTAFFEPVVFSQFVLSNSFNVVEGGGPDLRVRLLLPSSARLQQDFSFILEVANQGNVDAPISALLVSSPNGAPVSTARPVASNSPSSCQIFPVGTRRSDILGAGEQMGITLYAKATQVSGTLLRVDALSARPVPIDWAAQEPLYRDSRPEDEWRETWSSFLAKVGNTWATLYAAMQDAATRLNENGRQDRFYTGSFLVQQLLVESSPGLPEIGTMLLAADKIAPGGEGRGLASKARAKTSACDDACGSCPFTLEELERAYGRAQAIGGVTVLRFARTYVQAAILEWLSGSGRTLTWGPDAQVSKDFLNHWTTKDWTKKNQKRTIEALSRDPRITGLACGDEMTVSTHFDNKEVQYRDGGAISSLLGGIGLMRANVQAKVSMRCCDNGEPRSLEYKISIAYEVSDTYDFCPREGSLAFLSCPVLRWTMEPLEACGISKGVPLVITTPKADISGILPLVTKCPPPEPPVSPPEPGLFGGGGFVPSAAPRDPNDKVGPTGYGSEAFVGTQQRLAFTVDFENVPTATALAHTIRITDQLDPSLDFRTFRLGEIVFGTNVVSVPENRSFFQTRINIAVGATAFFADVSAGLNPASGQAFWTLTAIDPATGEQPDNPLLGLLPPNTTNHIGEGHVTYTIKPKLGLPTGTVITNRASIVFDNNEPIETNPVWNTIDGAAPTSSVVSLPPVVAEPVVQVSWSGADDAQGSGLKDFDVYVFDNSGAWTLWQNAVTNNAAIFTGQRGHGYRFYSAARDNAGNVEVPPATTDAETLISSNTAPVLAVITNRVVEVGGSISISNIALDLDASGQTLTFSLDPGAPVGITINATNGVLSWQPTRAQASTTNVITVRVTDDGLPPRSAAQTFTVVVPDYVEPAIGTVVLRAGQAGSVPITVMSSVRLTNLNFMLVVPPDRLTGFMLTPNGGLIGSSLLQPLDPGHFFINLSPPPGQFLRGTQEVAQLNFQTVPGQSSAFVWLSVTNVNAIRSDGTPVSEIGIQAGRLVIIAEQPLLEAGLGTNQTRLLTLYGKPGSNYALESKTNTMSSTAWQYGWSVTLTNLFQILDGVPNIPPTVFYRARELPLQWLTLERRENRLLIRLQFHGQSGPTYRLDTTTNLAELWSPVVSFSVSNSLHAIDWTNRGEPMRFFRVRTE